MDGANMNAIAGWIGIMRSASMLHNNLHKTWTIPHGGGPGDAIVAVSEKLIPFLLVIKSSLTASATLPLNRKSIGSFHATGVTLHIRCAVTPICSARREGAAYVGYRRISARYLPEHLREDYATLPTGSDAEPRMHDFILP